jgi:hypothetical protein
MKVLFTFALFALTFSLGSNANAFALPKNFPACRVQGGKAIPIIISSNFPSFAAAAYTPKTGPVIVINPDVAGEFSDMFNMWVYFHECGHHTLGHLAPENLGLPKIGSVQKKKEMNADCWGMRMAVKLGYIKTGADFNSVAAQMAGWPEDPEHPSGLKRIQNLRICLGAKN